ncbi:hypothetical protein AUK22_11710 [bacterium CG2_30_54_10]|nr:MAG: hypothetical protein AUK22_11710 [bacterium CG2_30_54_10]
MIWPFQSSQKPSALIEELGSSDPLVRKNAFTQLADSEDPDCDEEILGHLRNLPDSSSELLLALIDLVGKRGIEDGVDLLKPLLQEDENTLRTAALRALNRIPSQRSLDIIIPLLTDADLVIRKEVREAIIRLYGENAMGALLRSVPSDHASPLYFEISSLLDEMNLFSRMVENFSHPDLEVRKFHFQNLVKFHRPEFIPLYLQLGESAVSSLQGKLRNALSEYSPEEIIPYAQKALAGNPTKGVVQTIDDALFGHNLEFKEDLFKLAAGIQKSELRIHFLSRLTRKVDPFLFQPCLDLIDDPSPRIRTLVFDALASIHKTTIGRLADPNEEKKTLLLKLLEDWRQRIASLAAQGTMENGLLEVTRLFFILAEADHSLLGPVFARLLREQFTESMAGISSWPSEDQFELISETVRKDTSIAAVILSGTGRNPAKSYIKLLFKLLTVLPEGEREVFKRNLETRLKGIRITDFMENSDPDIRTATLEILCDIGGESLPNVLEEALKDLSPKVRTFALQGAIKARHPRMAKILEDATADPDPDVALTAIKNLRSALPADRFNALLSKLVGSPTDEIRAFVLKEIAKVTKQRYIANFKNLSAEVRKLAGSAILKLDGSFIDQLIGELKSLDPASRLRAALIMENIQVGGKGKEALMAAMKDPSRKVRAAVVKTLGVTGDKTLLTQLIEFFNDPDERVRANTIEAISGFGDARAVQILLPFLEDPNNRIRANAAIGVWQIGKVNVVPVVQKMLVHSDPLMKASGLWVLGEVRNEGVLNLILPFLRDTNLLIRVNALKAAAKIKPEALKPFLSSLRQDSSPEIRKILTDLSFKLI